MTDWTPSTQFARVPETEVGCWADGLYGDVHVNFRTVEIAERFGKQWEPGDVDAFTRYRLTVGHAYMDVADEMANEAVSYLNGFMPRGYRVDFVDGSLVMLPEQCTEYHVHNEYPHIPGHLYDCAACENSCHCDDGSCIYCGGDTTE